MKRPLALVVFTLLCASMAWSQGQDIAAILGYPQTILYNAKIVTVDDETFTSNVGTIAQAMAIRDGKVLALGSTAEMRALAGPQTQSLDLKGRTVLPGMITVHNHPQDWAHSADKIMKKVVPEDFLVQRFLTGTPAQQFGQFPAVLAEAVQAAKPGQWIKIILVLDINASPDDPALDWTAKTITKAQLDQTAPNNPVMVRTRPAILGQDISCMLNQLAFDEVRKYAPADELATAMNIDEAEKTGIVPGVPVPRMVENEVIFKDRLDLLTEAFRLDLQWWAALGQTTFGTFLYHHPSVIKAFRAIDRKGEMANRMAWGWGELPNAAWERDFEDPFLVADLATREGEGTDHIWYYGTGQVGGGCVTLVPLPNRPQDTSLVMRGGGCIGVFRVGGPVWNALYKVVKEGGRLIGSHQFGDVDIDNIINLIQRASREAGMTPEEIRAKRHTADHMQGWPRPDQVPALKQLGMIVGGTNLYIYQDAPRWMRDYGEKSVNMVVPRKQMIETGIMQGIEVDKPYELTDATLFTYLSWSITRRAQDGKVYAPLQRISREEALKTATIWPAYYVLRENLIGSLKPGKWADFLVIDKDYLTVPEDQIEGIRILMTSLGGKTVHLAPSLARELNMQPKGAAVELGGAPSNW